MIASPDRTPSGPTATPSGPTATPAGPAPATLVALVAHARSVPSSQREAFAETLRRLPDDSRRIAIRTCHRAELYATGEGVALPDLAELPAGVERLTDADAVRHLVAVACGLDSAVFGETQILHQLREALEERHADRPLDPVLERLFQSAFRAGREARSYFTGAPRSLADTALDRIAALSGGSSAATLDSSAPILVVGVGRMGRLAAFAASRRGARVIVTNRTAARAADLAGEVGGQVLPFGADGSLGPLRGVVVAIAGPWPLGPRDLETLAGGGTVVVDLSTPPAVGPEAAARLGPRLISVDDLAVDTGDGPDERTRRRVERLVSRAGTEFCQWLRGREAVPAIRAVVGAAEARRADEMAWLQRRLPDLSAEDLAVVEQMSHRLVAALLHAPLSALGSHEGDDLERAARELFGL
jgi:glutamyl-tRNA reductase